MQNAAGVFTQPDENNVTVALGYAVGRPDGTFDLRFEGPDPHAYFPSTYSYVLAQTSGWDAGKGAALAQYLCYAVSQGQEIAPQLRYARLSSVLVAIAIHSIVQIPGAPSAGNCPVAGSAPPPPPPVIVGGGGGGQGPAVGGTGPGGSGPGGTGPGGSGPGGGTGPGGTKKGNGSNSKVTGVNGRGVSATSTSSTSTTTTDPSVRLLQQLNAAAVKGRHDSSDHAPLWFLVLGVLAAAAWWAASGVLRRRVA